MTQVAVRYKVKPGHEAENEALVRAVYEELDERGPEACATRRSRTTTA